MNIEGFKLHVAKAMAHHAGISGNQATFLLNAAIRSSHLNTFKMFSGTELGSIKLSTEIFIPEVPSVFRSEGKIQVQFPSKAVLQFNVHERPQEITLFGLTPDLPQLPGQYAYEAHKLESGLVILCGTLGGNPVPSRPPPPPPKPKP